MSPRKAMTGISIGLFVSLVAFPAAALTQKQCSEKYQAEKTAGTLGDKSWNDFRKTECQQMPPPPRWRPKPSQLRPRSPHPLRPSPRRNR